MKRPDFIEPFADDVNNTKNPLAKYSTTSLKRELSRRKKLQHYKK